MEKVITKNKNITNNISGAISETFIFIGLSLIAFFTPIILRHPQMLIGIIVNMMLIKGALTLKQNKLIALSIFPSLGVLASGILFGNLTNFIIYLIPFIWISNYILTYIIKKFADKNYFRAIVLSTFLKTTFLFSITFLLFSLNILPKIFLVSMGYMQFVTAMIAGIIIFFELKTEKWLKKKN
ncbi:MAG: hypothetical protein PHZ07_03015 [Patescibacteria group bacterium]|nr:hypothetical protein [Patescibacteria group bacterium]MDD4304286.1 hypothetical protein [Patescibacteria group bacterium]MDD4695687.1 hypothetical protein [Patescibacteria group bacterium]